ncbi:DUF421 domain-containing protein [Cupriavidus yeoncheonensis]|nr:YetF domain-containing protein [Cupriavidus yeoncheonensis]
MLALMGEGDPLTWWQGAVRAIIVFLSTWLLLRVAGRRAFAQKTAFDLCVVLLLGAVLSRAIIGATAFPTAFAASLVLVLMHRAVGWLSSRYAAFDRITGGYAIDVVEHGEIDRARIAQAMVSEEDLKASLRASLQAETLEGVTRVVLERSGDLTFVRETKKPSATGGRATQAHANDQGATPASRHPVENADKVNGTSVSRWSGR